MPSDATPRQLIETTVGRRARHDTHDAFQDTCSFAQAERLFGREYHGRFIIELLQNAADAWRADNLVGDPTGASIILESDPLALVVANRGAKFSANTILDSLGQIGRSSKTVGKSIGHKGIGFKSVLEASSSPEVFSGMSASQRPALAVRFDRSRALEMIRRNSLQWDEWVEQDSDYRGRPELTVPLLRYPAWVDNIPAIVDELANAGFTTAIRLPFSEDTGSRDEWLNIVRTALKDVSDQTLLLLECFNDVVIDDRVAGDRHEIRVCMGATKLLTPSTSLREACVLRDDTVHSVWTLFRQQIDSGSRLLGETVVGVRHAVNDRRRIVHAGSGSEPRCDTQDPSAPFYLYFPTRIGSGLPFLVHGYFEVDAARTGFFTGAADQNLHVLSELAELVAAAIAHLADTACIDLVSLTEVLAAAERPESEQAKKFCDRVWWRLREIAWVPCHEECRSSPAHLLFAPPRLSSALSRVFPGSYVKHQTKRSLPASSLTDRAIEFLSMRWGSPDGDLWDTLATLYRPGATGPWPSGRGESRSVVSIPPGL